MESSAPSGATYSREEGQKQEFYNAGSSSVEFYSEPEFSDVAVNDRDAEGDEVGREDHGPSESARAVVNFDPSCAAPTHFKTVDELVHLVSGYLELIGLLSMSSVNHKWRASLMWPNLSAQASVIRDTQKILHPGEMAKRTKKKKKGKTMMPFHDMAERGGIPMFDILKVHPKKWSNWFFTVLIFILQLLFIVLYSVAPSVDHSTTFGGTQVWWKSLMFINCICFSCLEWMLVELLSWIICNTETTECGGSYSPSRVMRLCRWRDDGGPAIINTKAILHRFYRGILFSTLSIPAFVCVTVCADLVHITSTHSSMAPVDPSKSLALQDEKQQLGLTDMFPWRKDNTITADVGNSASLVQINNPTGWELLPLQLLIVDNFRSGADPYSFGSVIMWQKRSTAGWSSDYQPITAAPLNSSHYYSSSSSSSAAAAAAAAAGDQEQCVPVADAYPERAIFLDATPEITSTEYQVDIRQNPAPHGVETVNVVLLNQEEIMMMTTGNNNTLAISSPAPARNWTVRLREAAKLGQRQVDGKWNSLLIFDIFQFMQSDAIADLGLRCKDMGVDLVTVSSAELNATLQAAPHNLNATYIHEEVFFLAQSSQAQATTSGSSASSYPDMSDDDQKDLAARRTKALKYWLGRAFLNLSAANADLFSTPPKTMHKSGALSHSRVKKQLWVRTADSKFLGESSNTTVARRSMEPWILRYPGPCSFPTMISMSEWYSDAKNWVVGDTSIMVADPRDREPGALLYSGEPEFWYRGHGDWRKTVSYLGQYSDLPLMAQERNAFPVVVKSHGVAVFFFVMAILFWLSCYVVQLLDWLRELHHFSQIQALSQAIQDFNVDVKAWRQLHAGRLTEHKGQNPGEKKEKKRDTTQKKKE